MKPIQVAWCGSGVAYEVARRINDAESAGGEDRDVWDIEVMSEPFTIGSEDVETAAARLVIMPACTTQDNCEKVILQP